MSRVILRMMISWSVEGRMWTSCGVDLAQMILAWSGMATTSTLVLCFRQRSVDTLMILSIVRIVHLLVSLKPALSHGEALFCIVASSHFFWTALLDNLRRVPLR